ncbi:MAG: hypothetical protein GC154_20035 [bacterium]|nr:hypothetical protein [bacterium]
MMKRFRFPSFRFAFTLAFLAAAWLAAWYALACGVRNAWLDPAGVMLFKHACGWLLGLLAAAALLTRAEAGRARSRLGLAAECAAWAGFIALMIAIDWPPLRDGVLTSGDNLMHFTLASLTEKNLWSHFKLRGWCSAVGMGFPLNDLYPPGGNLIVVAFRALTLWLISLERVYAFTVFLSLLGYAFFMARAARRAGGRLAAIATLLLLVFDNGDWYFSWASSLDGGMWAILLGLGMSFNAFSLYAQPNSPASKKEALELIGCVAFSILLHPFYVFFNGFWLLCAWWTAWMSRGWSEASKTGAPLPRFVLFAFGYALAAFWWVPFALSKQWIFPYGYWGRSMAEFGRLMIEGTLFKEAPVYLTLLGLAAMAWGLFSRRTFIAALALFVLANLFLGSEPARYLLAVPAYADFFEHMQAERLIAAAKIGCILLIAIAAASGLKSWTASPRAQRLHDGLRGWIWPEQPQPWTRIAEGVIHDLGAALMGFAILIPAGFLLESAGAAAIHWQVNPSLKRVYSYPDDQFWPSFQDIKSAIGGAIAETPASDLLNNPLPGHRALTRIAWRMPAIAAYLPLSVYVTGYLPADVLGTRPLLPDEWTFDLARVDFIIDETNNPDPAVQAMTGLETLRENGRYTVYRRTPAFEHGWVLHGPGEVRRLDDEDGAMRFEFSGTADRSYFRLGISRYRKWSGRMNGQPVDLLLPAVGGESVEAWKFIGTKVSDGVLEIRYAPQWFDRAAFALSAAALALLIAFAAFRKPFEWLRALPSPPAWTARAASIVLSLGLAGGFIALAVTPAYFDSIHAEPKLQFLGNYVDQVGADGDRPDGQADMIFLLEFELADPNGVKELTLIPLDETGAERPAETYSTRHPHERTLAVLDLLGRRADRMDGSLDLPASRFQRMLIFANNPTGGAIPMPLRMKCVVAYRSGETMEVKLP